MARRFDNKQVVITGAAAGLGQTSAQLFAREGADLALLDINREGLEETAALVEAEGSKVSCHEIDLADQSSIMALGEQLCEMYPAIDVLFNNAGVAYGEVNAMVDQMDQDKWLHYLSINSLAPLFLARALRPSLANACGAIINQSSMAGYQPANVYGVTKAMLNSLTFGMANVLGGDGIRVNAIAPGIMETPASKDALDDATYQRIQGMQLLGELHGTAEDIARLALFLASDDARFINCEIVSCDAGNRMRGWRG